MKCEEHPDNDAIGTCVSCGRGVCEDCRRRVGGAIHCRRCAEAGKTPPASNATVAGPPAGLQPRPRGRPSRRLFLVGGIGTLLFGIVLLATGVLIRSWPGSWPWPGAMGMLQLMAALDVLAFVAITVGCIGIYWNYGSIFGAVGAVGIMVMGPLELFLIWLMMTMVPVYHEEVVPGVLFDYPTVSMGNGVTCALFLLCAFNARKFIPAGHISLKVLMAACITDLVGVALLLMMFLTFDLDLVGYFFVGAAMVMFSLFFWTAPMPETMRDGRMRPPPPVPGGVPTPMAPAPRKRTP